MASSAEREVVLAHALASAENLEVALLIGNSFSELCERVISCFLQALKHELDGRLAPCWQVSTGKPSKSAGWRRFVYCQYLGQPPGFHVGLGGFGNDDSPKLYFEVWHEEGDLEAGFAGQVRQRIDLGYLPGEMGKGCVWYQWLEKCDRRYGCWDVEDEQILVRLYRRGETVTWFAGHLESIARVLKGIIVGPAGRLSQPTEQE